MNTSPQHMHALEGARQAKRDQAEVRRALASAELSLSAALVDQRARRMRIWDLLGAQYGWGPDRCWRALDLAGRILWPDAEHTPPLSAYLRVGELGERERNALLQACRGGGR
jgi:hypothetical protein